MNVIKDFVEVITTLAFVLIFVLPFLKRKKKPEAEIVSSSDEFIDNEKKSVNNGYGVEKFLSNMLSETPQPEKKKAKEKKHVKTEPVLLDDSRLVPVAETSEPAVIHRAKPHPLFSNRQSLRQAIVLKEILDKPKGLE